MPSSGEDFSCHVRNEGTQGFLKKIRKNPPPGFRKFKAVLRFPSFKRQNSKIPPSFKIQGVKIRPGFKKEDVKIPPAFSFNKFGINWQYHLKVLRTPTRYIRGIKLPLKMCMFPLTESVLNCAKQSVHLPREKLLIGSKPLGDIQ